MTKRQLEKVRERFEDLDLSRYHILTYDEMLKVNGGSGSDSDDDDDEPFDEGEAPDAGEADSGNASETPFDDAPEENGKEAEEEPEENYHVTSHAEAANAEPGDTINRSDGSQYTLTERDIEDEQKYCDEHGINWHEEEGNESASANAGVPSEEPAEDLPEEEADDGGSSASDTPAQEEAAVASAESGTGRTDGTDSSATDSVKAASDEKADSAGKNSENTAENEGKHSGDNKSDAAEPGTKGNEKQAEGHSENTTKSGSDASSKENSSTPQENSRSADAAHQSASQPDEKSSHGFLDSVVDLFNDAKDWVCGVFGFGDGEKISDGNISDSRKQEPERRDGIYGAPTDSRRVTAGICERTTHQEKHTGIDIGAKTQGVKGDPIYAVADGVITRSGLTGSKSSRVEQTLPSTKNTAVYQHGEFLVTEGQSVKKGDVIGYMSDIGCPGQVHLHFEIREDGIYAGSDGSKIIDPLDYLPSDYSTNNY